MTNKDGISVEGAAAHVASCRAFAQNFTIRGTSVGELLNKSSDLILALSEREAAKDAEIARLRHVIEYLGGMEAFTVPFAIDHHSSEGQELTARIDFARAALTKGQVDG